MSERVESALRLLLRQLANDDGLGNSGSGSALNTLTPQRLLESERRVSRVGLTHIHACGPPPRLTIRPSRSSQVRHRVQEVSG